MDAHETIFQGLPSNKVSRAGEPIRLTLAALGLDWEEVHWGNWVETDNQGNQRFINIDWYSEFKNNTDLFEFNQAPRCDPCKGIMIISDTGKPYPQRQQCFGAFTSLWFRPITDTSDFVLLSMSARAFCSYMKLLPQHGSHGE